MNETEHIKYRGKILEIVELDQPNGRVFEIARRAPGVRLIISSGDGKKLLLSKEHRREAGGYDYRLPGGKVFDTLEEFDSFRLNDVSMLHAAMIKARDEGREESGLIIRDLKHFVTANCGATMEWDLYYFEVTQFDEHTDGQALEEGEDITVQWFDIDEVRAMLGRGEMQEYRSAGVLVQWLANRA